MAATNRRRTRDRGREIAARLKELQTLPGVGPSIAEDLHSLGFRSKRDLIDGDPEQMYRRLSRKTGTYIDPCVLYVFRCAVYAARTRKPKPELLLWWNWKGRDLRPAGRSSDRHRVG